MSKIIKRSANRGRKAAWDTADFETAQIIDDSLNFNLTPETPQQALQNLAQPQTQQPQNLSIDDLVNKYGN